MCYENRFWTIKIAYSLIEAELRKQNGLPQQTQTHILSELPGFYSKQFFPKLISPRQGRPSCERVQFQSRAEMLFVPLHIFCNKTTTLLTSSLTM